MRKSWSRVTSLIVIAAISSGGCSSILAPRPDPTRFYIVSASNAPVVAKPGTNALVIGLGPIAFPDYLARTDIVTRTADNKVDIAPEARWTEALDVSFKRVLASDLSASLGGAHVVAFPWFGTGPDVAYRIEVTVDRFECDGQGSAHLVAQWSIIKGADGETLYSSSSTISVPGAAGDYAAMAATLSKAEAQFAGQLAASVERLPHDKPS